jgi:hypothetical protein
MNQLNFIVYAPQFKKNVGGAIALYNIARIISEYKFDCKLFDFTNSNISNDIFDNYAESSDINDKTVVIYPEIISGNPLQAKYIVRWILCDLGVNCSKDIYKTWDKDDFVYHFGSYNPGKNVEQYNILSPFYLSPKLINHNKPREGYCHVIRKGNKIHQELNFFHPSSSLLLDDDLSEENLIFILNRKEHFISYDPYSFISFMAALCGCISIVAPMKGYTKEQWFKSLSISKFLSQVGENELKGIAYGLEEIDYTKKTLNEAYRQQQIVISFGKETVYRFVNDMSYLVQGENSVEILPRNENIFRIYDIFPEILKHDKLSIEIDFWETEKKKSLAKLKTIIKEICLTYLKLIRLKSKTLLRF